MNEPENTSPTSPPPPPLEVLPPARPFQPERARAPYGPGCAKPLALGCGLFLLLGIAGLVVMTLKRYEILEWSLLAMRPEIERRLAADATEEEKARVVSAVNAAAARARSGKMDMPALQSVQLKFFGLGSKQKLTSQELADFLTTLEAFAANDGTGATPSEAPPSV